MNEIDAIIALAETHQRHEWVGATLGDNRITDFIDISIPLSDDLESAIESAVENRIAATLDSYPEAGVAWESWCTEDIDADFSDIQAIIDAVD